MKILTEDELKLLSPYFSSFDIKNLSLNEKREYLILLSVYMNVFIKYLCYKFNLQYYDSLIKNSEYNFLPVEEKNMDIYQKFSKEYLKYFYIRNNIYIEKLDENELAFLREIAFSPNKKNNEEIVEFIESTFKKVIFEDALNDGSKCMVFFGEDSQYYSCVNDSIVIGLKYDEFNLNNLSDEEWDELHDKQYEFIDLIVSRMNKELNNDCNINLNILKY